MTVLYWASTIVITILISMFIKSRASRQDAEQNNIFIRNLPIFVIGAWIIWTLAQLSGPLMLFQLGVIAFVSLIGWVILKKFASYDRKLEKAIADAASLRNPNFDEAILREQAARKAHADAISKLNPIDGLENLKFELETALENAQNRILIMSGWASSYVINAKFIGKCIRLLSNGVEIHIGFGYDTSSDKKMPDWEKKGRGQINKLMSEAMDKKVDDCLFVYEFDNHYKSLVKDNDYFITGSINWLSNSRGKNYERAWKNEFSTLAEKEFNDCVSMMRPKKLILRRKFLKPFLEWGDDV